MAEAASEIAQRCQWCGKPLPAGASACPACGGSVPRLDVAPAEGEAEAAVAEAGPPATPLLALPEEDAAALPVRDRDVADDLVRLGGILGVTGLLGGLLGWTGGAILLAHVFEATLQMPSDGPGAFHRLGAFFGVLLGMLFGSLVGTLARR